jgi:hypothetical protein
MMLVVVLGAVACGGPSGAMQVTSPFTDEHARVFQDGIDHVADPSGLEGPWHDSWHADLETRVKLADVIATVTVRTIRTDVDLDRRKTLRLVADVDDTLLGSAPADDVVLVVREGQAGFPTVEGNERRVLDQPFVAYIKWSEGPDGGPVPRWHLAPATPGVIDETKRLVRRTRDVSRSEPRGRTIVHEH